MPDSKLSLHCHSRPTISSTQATHDLAERWALWSVEGIGYARLTRLHELCHGDLSCLWTDRALVLRCIKVLSLSAKIQAALHQVLSVPADVQWQALNQSLLPGESVIHRSWREYPVGLFDLSDPPEFIFVRGELSLCAMSMPLALVGSRQVPSAQQRFATALSLKLASSGVTVVSGGARGMDTCAHQGALDAHAATVAVLPGGMRELAPRQNVRLFNEIVDGGGALVSEYPLTCAPRRYHYARRNRVIAAMSRGVVVLKAAKSGGTLLTVKAAQELGRMIMALPYEANDYLAGGSHALIQSGEAIMVCGEEDILRRAFGVIQDVEDGRNVSGEGAKWVYSWKGRELVWPLPHEICDVEQLVVAWKLSGDELQVALFELEFNDCVRKVPGAARYEPVYR